MIKRGLATKKKDFFEALKKFPNNVATKLQGKGGGCKALLAGPLKKNFYFFAASLTAHCRKG